MNDHRVTNIKTADAIAKFMPRWKIVTITGAAGAYAVYIFGKRIYSKGWQK